MNKILVLAILIGTSITSAFSQSQTKDETLHKSDRGWSIKKSITIFSDTTKKSDTLIYFYLPFQNNKYTHITDIGSIFLTEKNELDLFANKLREFANTDQEGTTIFESNGFTLKLYDFARKTIYIEDKDGKYFTCPKKIAIKLADEIQQFSNLLK